MPTSHCKFPEHHTGPSAGSPLSLLAAIAIGAVVVAHWHAVVVALVVVGVLVCAAIPVFWLWHNHGSAYDPELEQQAALERARRAVEAQRRVTAAAVPDAPRKALESAPVVHNHLHIHGVSADDVAELVTRHQEQRQVEGQPW